MKKILIVLSILFVSTALHAQFLQFGPVAMLTAPLSKPEGVESYDSLGIEDFRFGADVRVNLGLLQAGVLGLFEAPGANGLLEPGQVILVPTIGVNASLLIFDVGIGIGPGLEFNFGDDSIERAADFGIHLKGTADVNLGKFSIGVILGTSYSITPDLPDFGDKMDIYGGLAFLINI